MEGQNVVTNSDSALVRYLDAKRLKARTAEEAELAKFQLIASIREHGDIIFTDGDTYKIATVKGRISSSLNKEKLSIDTGNDYEELTTLGLVELAERGELTASELEEYYEDSQTEVVSIRKLSKEEIASYIKK